ncbi:MAG TPA: hypothetical protein VFU05_05305, partial [Cyclobacteriaceae bacterium]|nr:hypothetical protein [Cyclobacteriaceae bacterium]
SPQNMSTTTNASIPTELYTPKTMFSLGGGSAAVWIFTTILAWVFHVDVDKYKWIGLCVAMALSFIGAATVKKLSVRLSTVAFFNGLLIYITAVGIDSINQGINSEKTSAKTEAALISFTAHKPWWPAVTLLDSIKKVSAQYVEANLKQEDLSKENMLLHDSLTMTRLELQTIRLQVSNPGDNKSVQTDVNEKLLSQLQRCTAELQKRCPEIPRPVEGKPDLSEFRKLNTELLENINQYLSKGQPSTCDDLYLLKDLNEKIYSFKLQLEEINKEIGHQH